MLEAFEAGGDFHSIIAMNMYPYIRQAVDNKEVLLEWHPQPGEDKPPVPLLKASFLLIYLSLHVITLLSMHN
jgi:DNA polymerase-1